MKTLFNFVILLFCNCCIAQNVGISNDASLPDNSALLDVKSTTKGLLTPRMTQTQRNAIISPANGLLVYQTDGLQGFYYNSGTTFSPNWVATASTGNSWSISGNSLIATGTLGTTSNNSIDLVTNNIVRGRLSNLGEFLIGATNTTTPGDLMSGIGNATFPFAVNGFTSFNGAGIYGSIQGGNTQFAGVQGEYQSSVPGTFNTAGVRGSNQSNIAGTGFRTQGTAGPRVGVIGNTTAGSGQYTFGLHGSMSSTDIRCGGVFGDDFGIAMASLAYYAANLVDYSVYGFGRAYETGVFTGRNNTGLTEPNTNIGLGIYGGMMGGWIKGLVYGTHLKGERYSLYVDGKTYTNEPVAELAPVADGNRIALYSMSTSLPEVVARGKATLQNGKQTIQFNEAFLQMAKADDIVITVSPMSNSKGLYIAEQNAKGFMVKENGDGNGIVGFSWIAIAARKGFDAVQHSPEILKADFDEKMNNVMYNDNNVNGKPQPIWWDGKQMRFDQPPAKKIDNNYQPVIRQTAKTL